MVALGRWLASAFTSTLHTKNRHLCGILAGFTCGLLAILGLTGCGGSTSPSPSNPSPSTVAVAISPLSASAQTGGKQQFSATVTGTSNAGVTWSATGGTVSSSGLFTAGNTVGTYNVIATSMADSSKSAQATVTVTAPPSPPGTASSISIDGITWTFSVPVPWDSLLQTITTWWVLSPSLLLTLPPQPPHLTRTARC